MTQRELKQRGGSEMFTIEVGRELRSRGHDVAIFTSAPGELVQPAQVNGIWVEDKLEKIPFVPDIIHGQHHLHLLAALTRFPGVPAISYCHGLPWVENPPLHPRIKRYVAICKSMKPRLVTAHHIPEGGIHVIENFFDPERFHKGTANKSRDKLACLYGNFRMTSERLGMIREACELEGYTFEAVGNFHSNNTDSPEALFPSVKAAFALGRSAIEAMACGCAVIPASSEKVAPLITPENLEERAASNFCPRIHGNDPTVSIDSIRTELRKIPSSDIDAVTDIIRSRNTLHLAVDRLEEVYTEAIHDFSSQRSIPLDQELRSLSLYLERVIPEIEEIFVKSFGISEQHFLLREMQKAAAINAGVLPYLESLTETARARTTKLRENADTYQRLMSYMQSRFLGRYLLKRFGRKKRSRGS